MRAGRSITAAAAAVLLGGCLIVRTHEERVEEPCPSEVTTELLADASGPFVVADAIYFVGASGTLSRLSFDGGPVSELTSEPVGATRLVADATDLYWTTDTAIVRKPLAGGAPVVIADGYADLTELLVDDTSVVWASAVGLERWSKADQTITSLDTAAPILGLAAREGIYYYSHTRGDRVRKSPPIIDVTMAHSPGPLVVDEDGVHFYEVAEPFIEYGGALRFTPHAHGPSITTVTDLSLVYALARYDDHLYFATAYDNEYRIKWVSRFGGNVRTLACGTFEQRALHVASSLQYVYFADGRGLHRFDKSIGVPY
jgi:hypothetical protein